MLFQILSDDEIEAQLKESSLPTYCSFLDHALASLATVAKASHCTPSQRGLCMDLICEWPVARKKWGLGVLCRQGLTTVAGGGVVWRGLCQNDWAGEAAEVKAEDIWPWGRGKWGEGDGRGMVVWRSSNRVESRGTTQPRTTLIPYPNLPMSSSVCSSIQA